MILAMEGRDRKLNRRDWPAFLNRIVPQGVWQSFSNLSTSPPDDPRVRWSRKFIVLAYTAMGWAAAKTLDERFAEARHWIVDLFPSRKRPGSSCVGLTKAATRHGVYLFHEFWSALRRTMPTWLKETWNQFGWIPLAADGSRADAPRTRANEAGLGRCTRDKSHPQWWMTWLVHLPTLLLWDWRQGPGTSSERSHLLAMLPDLPANALIIGDAGFGGFDFLSHLNQAGVSFLVRCAGNTTLETRLTPGRIEACGDVRDVYLWPQGRRGQCPLRLRQIVLKRGGRRVYLVTNVFDCTALSRSMAGEFYELRWGVEVNYRDFKRTMERSKVLSRTPECGALELGGDIIAMGLLRLHAAIVQLAKGTRISVTQVLKLLRRAMEHLRYGVSTVWLVPALKQAITDDYHRKRPKSSRDWPRKKHTRPPTAPKYRKLGERKWTELKEQILSHAA